MKHLKIKIMSIAFMAVATSSMAQSLNKMNWLNEPQQWGYIAVHPWAHFLGLTPEEAALSVIDSMDEDCIYRRIPLHVPYG